MRAAAAKEAFGQVINITGNECVLFRCVLPLLPACYPAHPRAHALHVGSGVCRGLPSFVSCRAPRGGVLGCRLIGFLPLLVDVMVALADTSKRSTRLERAFGSSSSCTGQSKASDVALLPRRRSRTRARAHEYVLPAWAGPCMRVRLCLPSALSSTRPPASS